MAVLENMRWTRNLVYFSQPRWRTNSTIESKCIYTNVLSHFQIVHYRIWNSAWFVLKLDPNQHKRTTNYSLRYICFKLSRCFVSKLKNVYLQHEHLLHNSSKNCRYLWEKYTHKLYGKIWKSHIVRLIKTLTCLENLFLDRYWVDNMTLCFWYPFVYFKKVSIWIVIASK